MSNHPSRAWRRVMHDAADTYIAHNTMTDGGPKLVTPDQLRQLLIEAYTAGYTEGRASRARTNDPR